MAGEVTLHGSGGARTIFTNDGVAEKTLVEFEYGAGDSLNIMEAGTCIVELYSLQVTAANWVTVAKFGSTGLDSMDAITAAGFVLNGINDYKTCGYSGCTGGGCASGGCNAHEEYAGFWCGGECAGSIEFPMPVGYNKGRLHLGMSYSNAACHGESLRLHPRAMSRRRPVAAALHNFRAFHDYLSSCPVVQQLFPIVFSTCCHSTLGTVSIGGEAIFDEFYSGTGSRYLEFDYSVGDTLVIGEAGTCIVDVYSIQVSTIVPQPVNAFDWQVLATFGDTGINSLDALTAGGWTAYGINDYQVCGLAGCSAGWCGNACTGSHEYAGFWCGGDCSGSIEYALPDGYNRGVITVGVTYDSSTCHGTVTVGGRNLLDNLGVADLTKLEFMYEPGDTIVVAEGQTCIVDVSRP